MKNDLEKRVKPKKLDPSHFYEVGNKIVFNPMATMKLDYDGQEYLSIFSRDILAIIEE